MTRGRATFLKQGVFIAWLFWLSACTAAVPSPTPGAAMSPTSPSSSSASAEAVFAGGCFWCMEAVFEQQPGVIEAIAGYTGGHLPNPTYEQVSSGQTGHYEAVVVRYDPTQTSYERLLETFWKHIDPTDPNGQFYDRGPQYRTAIFYLNAEQQHLAETSKTRIAAAHIFAQPLATQILPAGDFYVAEGYHQNYYQTHPAQYQAYHLASGKDDFLADIWAQHPYFRLFPERQPYWRGYRKPTRAALRALLTPLQFAVTQENATEPPFQNAYWDHHAAGIYVDVVSGEPLFSSRDKYDSGSGWPSFTRPLEPANIVTREDFQMGMLRTEVRSRHADSHLGHVFPDGPPPTNTRYCINAAALRFIPVEDLVKQGYSAYLSLFAP